MKSPECSNCEQWAIHSANSERPTKGAPLNIKGNEIYLILLYMICLVTFFVFLFVFVGVFLGFFNQTELSKHIWKLKGDGSPYTLTWTIKKRAQPYSPRTKRCNLCLWEKFFIITADKNTTLNARTELTSTCRHKKKFFVSEYG